ncbi:phosphatidyl ethanolamine N-methyltransferase [Scheffersomyces xylosifermentans]|uniref:phosphatidyl ethanolamine N-methyltransferase n=1 Tax=Scheffersomyces xylosifermentans TaxID=1304137 RepID=UPI00315D145D
MTSKASVSTASASAKKKTSSSTATDSPQNGPKGITFSGDTFVVPETHDMVKTLFDPTVRKSNLELVILACLFSNLLVFYFVTDNQLRINIFIGLYIFWRLSYNFGIGYLLYHQSNYNRLVEWSRKLALFDGKSKTALSKFIRAEIKSQRGPNYDIDSYPIEFNTWLIFRKFVDLVLMSDFVTFVLVVYTCAINDHNQFLHDQKSWLVNSRLVVGGGFILFNLWVKVNAHNTIKDYAWYWGDFFFRQINNEELIFDGVFEMFPHPMYSVGYIGYYGFALIAKSYTVLVIAIFGHFLQMIFLHYIENPHIDKIYGPSKNEINLSQLVKLKDLKNFDNLKPLVGLYNFNWLRASDVVNLILVLTYGVLLPIFASSSNKFVLNFGSFNVDIVFLLAVCIKIVESLSINGLLVLQSHSKFFTKWYLANDIPLEKSLNNWAIIYNSLINLTYASLFGVNLYHFLQGTVSEYLFSQWFYLRIFLGALLVFTQTWINSSMIDSIGYFGWFYGDFFIPKSRSSINHLTKAGVYRYLNNPEQIFGVCGVMGVFIIVPSVENLVFCFLWVANNFLRINFVERMHMIKIYGEHEVLKDSGVTKTFKKHLLPEVLQRRLSNDYENDQTSRRRKSSSVTITDSLDNFIRELKTSKTKLSKQKLVELSQSLSFENSDYKLQINGLKTESSEDNKYLPKYVDVGTPLEVKWYSPEATHSSQDWIGLYRIVQTSYSRNKTLISSSGRWTWCEKNSGTAVFKAEKLFWDEGLYEFRYHLAGKHDVAYISEPFEIKIPSLTVPVSHHNLNTFATDLRTQIVGKLLNINTNTDSISAVANDSEDVLEVYKLLSKLISKSTDINISPKVFLSDDVDGLNVTKLASKIINIKKVLEELSYNDNDYNTSGSEE